MNIIFQPVPINVEDTTTKDVVVNGGRQKAIVKPHVLTHVIGGFVIQEAPEPFPVSMKYLLFTQIYTRNGHC